MVFEHDNFSYFYKRLVRRDRQGSNLRICIVFRYGNFSYFYKCLVRRNRQGLNLGMYIVFEHDCFSYFYKSLLGKKKLSRFKLKNLHCLRTRSEFFENVWTNFSTGVVYCGNLENVEKTTGPNYRH